MTTASQTTNRTVPDRFAPLVDRLKSEQTQQFAAGEEAAMRRGTHSVLVGYLTWILGVFGAHRFYYGKPVSGTIYFFTGGLLLVGWIVDLFLIPSMHREAERRYVAGEVDYNVAWLLVTFLGVFGAHRLYMGKWLSGGFQLLVGVGVVAFFPIALLAGAMLLWDFLTLNEQVTEINMRHA